MAPPRTTPNAHLPRATGADGALNGGGQDVTQGIAAEGHVAIHRIRLSCRQDPPGDLTGLFNGYLQAKLWLNTWLFN